MIVNACLLDRFVERAPSFLSRLRFLAYARHDRCGVCREFSASEMDERDTMSERGFRREGVLSGRGSLCCDLHWKEKRLECAFVCKQTLPVPIFLSFKL